MYFNAPSVRKSHGKSLWSRRSECSLFQSAVIQLRNGHTRLSKLTLIALKELPVSHVRENGLKSTFVFQVASKAGGLSGVSYLAWGGTKYDRCLLEGFCRIITISSHMITQTMADLKLKPRVSRRKLKDVLKLRESKMFSLGTGHVNQVQYPLDYEQSLFFLGPSGTPSFLASRGFAAQRSRACALPLLNLKKKRHCSQSNYQWDDIWQTFKRMFSCWLEDRAAIICRFRNEENWSS